MTPIQCFESPCAHRHDRAFLSAACADTRDLEVVPVGNPLSDLVASAWALDPNYEGGLSGRPDLHLRVEAMKIGHDGGRVWMLNVEGLQGESRRCCGRWVWCVAPTDEERDYSCGQRVAGDAPSQHGACSCEPVAVDHVARVEALGASLAECSLDVVAC